MRLMSAVKRKTGKQHDEKLQEAKYDFNLDNSEF